MTDAWGRTRPDRAPTSAPTAPTPSMLAYAFGEKVASPAGRVAGAKLIPCSGRTVDGDELAVTLVHIAIWDLGRRGIFSLDSGLADEAGRPGVIVRPERRALLEDEFPGSLERRLFGNARERECDLRQLIALLYPENGEPVTDPFGQIFELQNEAMLEARLMRRDVEGRIKPAPELPPEPGQLVWLCERVAQFTVAFATIETEWQRYRTVEPEASDSFQQIIRTAVESGGGGRRC